MSLTTLLLAHLLKQVAVCLQVGSGMPYSARIGRALFHRAHSASTGGAHSRLHAFRSPNLARRDLTGGADLGAHPPQRLFFIFFPSRPVFHFRARAGRLSERDQSAVGLPLLLSYNGCRRQWQRMSEATPSRSAGVASFRRQVEAKARAVNGALWLRAERASQLWPARLSHRPLFFIPRHFPKHPLIA